MASKSGKCRTVGYVSPITGQAVLFDRPRVSGTRAKREVEQLRARDMRVVERRVRGDWDSEIDDILFPEVSGNV